MPSEQKNHETLNQYITSIKDFPPLKKEEERSLLRAYKLNNDLSARDLLIKSNLRYACKLASGFKSYGLPLTDLISEANKGLIDAIERFDLSNDVKVISYSKWWIIQRMQNAIVRKTRMPESELPYQGADDYDNDAIFDATGNIGEERPEFIVNDEEKTDARCDTDFIEDIMSILSDREADILNMYYGRCGYKENTLDEIGKKYNLTKERVRQIMRTALNKIRSESMKSDSQYLSR